MGLTVCSKNTLDTQKIKMAKTGNVGIASLGAAQQKKLKNMSQADRKAYYKSNAEKAKKSNKAMQAGLQFPTNRVRRNLKKATKEAAIYAAAVLEYLIAEAAELAGNIAIDKKKKRVMPRHLMMAIKGDEELNKLLGNVVFASAGRMPVGVHPALKANNMPKKDFGSATQKN